MFLFNNFNPRKPSQGRYPNVAFMVPKRTLDYSFSPLATYCEIFHTHKPMGLLSGGLNKVVKGKTCHQEKDADGKFCLGK